MRNLCLDIIVICGSLILAAGCFSPDPSYSFHEIWRNAGRGAYPRLVERDLEILDLRDPVLSTYNYTVEFVDVNQGGQTAAYVLYAQYVDVFSGAEDEVLFKEITYNEFYPNENGHFALDMSVQLTELLDALNKTIEDISAGSTVHFRTVLALHDGLLVSAANSTNTVNGSALGSYFDFMVVLTCPLSDDMFTGRYKIEYLEFIPGPKGPIFGIHGQEVFIRALDGSTTLREFNWHYSHYDIDPLTWRFDIRCNEMQLETMSLGLGCGVGSMTVEQNGSLPVNINDDSEMVWNIIEFAEDGGCDFAPNPITVRFIKL